MSATSLPGLPNRKALDDLVEALPDRLGFVQGDRAVSAGTRDHQQTGQHGKPGAQVARTGD